MTFNKHTDWAPLLVLAVVIVFICATTLFGGVSGTSVERPHRVILVGHTPAAEPLVRPDGIDDATGSVANPPPDRPWPH
jgi:hypothetical protein